ncbi:nucleotidyl transferase AbiEii/AbiGii toxin family protein, partial [Helicobacter fennelliae]
KQEYNRKTIYRYFYLFMVFYRFVGTATSHLGNYPLKIEVSGRERNRLRLLKDKNIFYQNINGVNVYNIDKLIAMKINAFNGRDKVRDLFDINFLFEHYPELFAIANLESIITKFHYYGEKELDLLLEDETHTHKLTSCEEIKTNGFSNALLQKVQNRLNELENESTNENVELVSSRIRKYR